MKNLFVEIKTSLLAMLLLGLILCGVYPFLVWGGANLFFGDKAHGSLIEKNGAVIGSELIGQNFTSLRYFHSRPSAAGKGYDAAASSGSNLGLTSQKWVDSVTKNIEDYRRVNGLAPETKIPGDAVTASASGLDPHISPKNAALQSARVARERGLDLETIHRLVLANTDRAFLTVIGEDAVNVLKLNLALDHITSH
ncbi:MAG: K(+)-transporting ATPase subunit C [Proteobacteria bacterium]|nr:MAG: K(+)-transporting ATPase subunit C [Pseudomonadota bacterium]